VWALGLVSACVANQYYFPNSKFVGLTALILVNQPLTKAALIFCLSLDTLLITIALLSFTRALRQATLSVPLLIGLAVTSGFTFLKSGNRADLDAATYEHPNIILVGVDSLRPDFLSYFGHEKPTPFFDSFLSQASVFSEAVTPLARTFPSWTSILSGLYPREIGIRTNLAQQHVNFTNMLPAILQRNGYKTIFATDETRFSNIDRNFGFDHIIAPPMGLNDFLIGTFNDFPLSNFLINTNIGKWLFPYSYGNRPVYFSYDPDSFLNLLSPILNEKRAKPTFLAVHFCLTHSPYLWDSLNGSKYNEPLERYEASIGRVDKQVNDFFALLKQGHWLDHAIVVLLSDHGEALELPGDRITEKDLFVTSKTYPQAVPLFYPPSLDDEGINESAGHGTDVLGLPQYHTVLAFKLYGLGDWQSGLVPGIVSLLDIKPTILQFIHLPSPASSGRPLVSVIRGEHKLPTQHHHIFLESDFSPEAIRTVYPETRRILLDGIELFRVDPVTTRLIVKDNMEQMIIDSKQYADIYGDWILAFYPQNKHFQVPILVNLVTGKWTNNLQSPFARSSPAALMLRKLKAFYTNEINDIRTSA
jgi:arylsulfatase A-like enzyme